LRRDGLLRFARNDETTLHAIFRQKMPIDFSVSQIGDQTSSVRMTTPTRLLVNIGVHSAQLQERLHHG